MSKIKNFQGAQTPLVLPSTPPIPPRKQKPERAPIVFGTDLQTKVLQKVLYYLHKYELLIQCINLPCLCLFLGIHSLRWYEARGEPNNFCCPIADDFVGAANLLTVSRNRLGRLIGICGYLEVNFSVRMSATDCVLASISAASRKSISSLYAALSICKIKDDIKTEYTLY